MGNATCILVTLWLAAAGSSLADVLKPPPMTGTGEKGSVVAKDKDGTVRWKAQWTMERTQRDKQDAIRMTESGQGSYSGFTQQVRWNIEAWWSSGDAFRPLRFDKTVTDASGKVLMQERKQFDWTKNEVRFERHELKTGKTTVRVLASPSDTIAAEGIAGALRSLPFSADLEFQSHFLTNEPKLYTVTLKVRSRETIHTATGTFDCYKVELVPHLGALGALRFLFPKVYFWFTVDPQHTWIRYQGPESGPGTPEIIMDRAG